MTYVLNMWNTYVLTAEETKVIEKWNSSNDWVYYSRQAGPRFNFLYMIDRSFTPGNTLFTSLFFCFLEKNVHPLFLGGSLPFISSLLASYPSTCMPQGISQYTCLIKALLKVVEGVASYKVTIHVLFSH